MNGVRPIGNSPNLPENQRFTQRLADQFNADERVWLSLEPLRRLRRLLHPRMSCRKREKLDLADFAHAQPPKDCVAQWRIGYTFATEITENTEEEHWFYLGGL